jgi:hypothetical protein
MLSGALESIFVLSEAYPDLKAAGNFQKIQGTLANLEEALQSARRCYNAVVRDYNTKIHSVPSNILAQSFNFAEVSTSRKRISSRFPGPKRPSQRWISPTAATTDSFGRLPVGSEES